MEVKTQITGRFLKVLVQLVDRFTFYIYLIMVWFLGSACKKVFSSYCETFSPGVDDLLLIGSKRELVEVHVSWLGQSWMSKKKKNFRFCQNGRGTPKHHYSLDRWGEFRRALRGKWPQDVLGLLGQRWGGSALEWGTYFWDNEGKSTL